MHDTSKNTNMLPVEATLQQGKYRIDQHLSSGGFGNTYLATNVNFDEQVAIKEFFMADINSRQAGFLNVTINSPAKVQLFLSQLEKFKKEARRIRKLSHKNIVGVSDLFDENGTSYYVMDYIEGASVQDMIERRGPLPEQEVMGYLLQALDALEEVHSKGIFHLDIKPSNLMIDTSGNLLLIDFGASKQQKIEGGATSRSAICYTPGFAPIEQKDQEYDNFGPWTDIYALGATLCTMLTAANPPSITQISDHGAAAFNLPQTVSEPMCKLITWMMQGRRQNRPQSVKEIREYIMENMEQQETDEESHTDPKPEHPAPPTVTDEPIKPNRSKVKWLIAAACIAAVAIAAAILIPSAMNGNTPQTAALTDSIDTSTLRTVEGQICNSTIGQFMYTGHVDGNDLPHDNNATAIFIDNDSLPDGREYHGEFRHGAMHGKCTEYKFGKLTFTGTFENDHFKEGTLTDTESGKYFEGTFADEQPYTGKWYYKSGYIIYGLRKGELRTDIDLIK